MGHPAPSVYTAPHFDFHFYDIPDSLRQTITGSPTTPDPGAQFRPAGYAAPAATVPGMGGHSYDLTGPAFNCSQFTQSMLYGFYNLQMAFLEGAGSQAYVLGLSGQQLFVLRPPAKYALPVPAIFPHSQQFSYDAANDQYLVNIGGFASVPEPGSLSLLGLSGFAVLAFRRSGFASRSKGA